jgi:hypothetical protein
MKRSKDWLPTLVLVAMLSAFTCQAARAEEEEEKEYEPADLSALVALLPDKWVIGLCMTSLINGSTAWLSATPTPRPWSCWANFTPQPIARFNMTIRYLIWVSVST